MESGASADITLFAISPQTAVSVSSLRSIFLFISLGELDRLFSNFA